MHLFISLLNSVTDLVGTGEQLKALWVLAHSFPVPTPTQHPVPAGTGLLQENRLSMRMHFGTRPEDRQAAVGHAVRIAALWNPLCPVLLPRFYLLYIR